MSEKKTPFGLKRNKKRSCCSPSDEVTIIDVDGRKIGIRKLSKIFEDLEEKGISPDEVDVDRLMSSIKEDNDLLRKKEKKYKDAIISEYEKFVN